MVQELSNKDLFETMPVPQAVAKMCIPGIFSAIVTTLYTLTDTYFVGMLNDPVQNAAIALAAATLYINMAISNWFGTGTSSYMSRALGRGDLDSIRKVTAMGIWWSVIIGGLVSLAYGLARNPVITILGADEENFAAVSEYLFWTLFCGAIPSILNVVMANMVTAEGFAAYASVGTMSGCILNIVLDPFFVLPQFLNMGAAGAGMATCLSNCAAVIYFIVLITMRKGKTYITLHPREFHFNWELFKGISIVGIPAAVQALTFIINGISRNNVLGKYGSIAVAAYGISYRIAMIPTTITIGTALGIMPLLGYNYSRKNRKRMQNILSFTLKIGILFSIAVAILFFIFSENLMYLFIKDPEVVQTGAVFLKISCPSLIFMFTANTMVSVLQACGKGRKVMVIVLARKFALEIPVMILLDRVIPVYGMAFGEPIEQIVVTFVCLVIVKRLFDVIGSKTEKIAEV